MNKPGERHQLRASYPFTGNRKLLMWYEHNEGNHIFLARNDEQLEIMLKHKLNKIPRLTLKMYRDADIVLPPQQICENYAKKRLAEDINNCHSYFLYLSAIYAEYSSLPRYIKKCENYVGNHYINDHYCKEHHIGCTNCNSEKYYLNGITKEELFAKIRHLHDPRSRIGKKLISTSLGDKQYNPEWILYCAALHGGHHQRGVVIEEVQNIETYEPDNLLFFFHSDDENKVPERFIKIVKIHQEQIAAKKEMQQKKYEDEQNKRKREHIAEFRRMIDAIGM